MIVNVGTVGHVDHRRDVAVIVPSGFAGIVIRLSSPHTIIHDVQWLIRPKSLGIHKGKGQRKANKANRWK